LLNNFESAPGTHGSEAPANQPGRSLAIRLDNVKAQYQNDILPLAQQREALVREIAELKAVRDVFLEETTVLNARNEELAQLSTLYTRRVESSTPEQPQPQLSRIPGRVASLEKSRQGPAMSQSISSGTTGIHTSDETDPRSKVQRAESAVELSTPQSKGKFMKWGGSKAKDFVSSAVSAIAVPEFVKGKPFLEHTFQQLSVLRFTRCNQCGDKMFGSQLRCSGEYFVQCFSTKRLNIAEGCHISVHVRCINHVATACSQQTSSNRDESQLCM
jgi:Rho-type GTPase-activating protein 1/2